MYRAGMEGILGIRREGAVLIVAPCLPAAWPGFEAVVELGDSRYDIRVESLEAGGRATAQAVLDGTAHPCSEGRVRVLLDGGRHDLRICL